MYTCAIMCFLFGFWLLLTLRIIYLHVAFSVHEKLNVQLKPQEKSFWLLCKDLFYLVLHHGRMNDLLLFWLTSLKCAMWRINPDCVLLYAFTLIYFSFGPHKPFHKLYNELKLCFVYFFHNLLKNEIMFNNLFCFCYEYLPFSFNNY